MYTGTPEGLMVSAYCSSKEHGTICRSWFSVKLCQITHSWSLRTSNSDPLPWRNGFTLTCAANISNESDFCTSVSLCFVCDKISMFVLFGSIKDDIMKQGNFVSSKCDRSMICSEHFSSLCGVYTFASWWVPQHLPRLYRASPVSRALYRVPDSL